MFSYPFLDLHRSVRRITYAAARYLICIGDKRLYGLLKRQRSKVPRWAYDHIQTWSYVCNRELRMGLE